LAIASHFLPEAKQSPAIEDGVRAAFGLEENFHRCFGFNSSRLAGEPKNRREQPEEVLLA